MISTTNTKNLRDDVEPRFSRKQLRMSQKHDLLLERYGWFLTLKGVVSGVHS